MTGASRSRRRATTGAAGLIGALVVLAMLQVPARGHPDLGGSGASARTITSSLRLTKIHVDKIGDVADGPGVSAEFLAHWTIVPTAHIEAFKDIETRIENIREPCVKCDPTKTFNVAEYTLDMELWAHDECDPREPVTVALKLVELDVEWDDSLWIGLGAVGGELVVVSALTGPPGWVAGGISVLFGGSATLIASLDAHDTWTKTGKPAASDDDREVRWTVDGGAAGSAPVISRSPDMFDSTWSPGILQRTRPRAWLEVTAQSAQADQPEFVCATPTPTPSPSPGTSPPRDPGEQHGAIFVPLQESYAAASTVRREPGNPGALTAGRVRLLRETYASLILGAGRSIAAAHVDAASELMGAEEAVSEFLAGMEYESAGMGAQALERYGIAFLTAAHALQEREPAEVPARVPLHISAVPQVIASKTAAQPVAMVHVAGTAGAAEVSVIAPPGAPPVAIEPVEDGASVFMARFDTTQSRPGRYVYPITAFTEDGEVESALTLHVAPRPPTCGGHKAGVYGTARSNEIAGTAGSDVIHGLGGNDVIVGRGGRDVICGGPGRDVLSGGAGDDVVYGGRGRDRLMGGAGRDVLRGGGANDFLIGGRGRDLCVGGVGTDRILVGTQRRCERYR